MRLRPDRAVRAVERIDDAAEADRCVLEHLAELGSDLADPHEATHFVYVPTQEAAGSVAGLLAADGWLTHVERCPEDGTWLVVAQHVATLTPALVRLTRRLLEELAAAHGGLYDGWEAKVNT